MGGKGLLPEAGPVEPFHTIPRRLNCLLSQSVPALLRLIPREIQSRRLLPERFKQTRSRGFAGLTMVWPFCRMWRTIAKGYASGAGASPDFSRSILNKAKRR